MIRENLFASPRIRPEIRPKFFAKLGPNPARTQHEKSGPIYNSGTNDYFFQKRLQNFNCKLIIANIDQSS